jgi:hypothetical protein
MPSDTQFTALGPAIVGFQTSGTNIDLGVGAVGTKVGVHGSGPIGVAGDGTICGVQGKGSFVGVQGTGSVGGVSGEGFQGVIGKGTVEGVRGEGITGVHGIGDGPFQPVGVKGECSSGPGVLGESGSGPGGEFISKQGAQLHLKPLHVRNPTGTTAGRPGDPLASFAEEKGALALWFCTEGGDQTTAIWKRVQLV